MAAGYPTLPTYRGLPVPFVTRRMTEIPQSSDPRWGTFGFMRALDVLTGETFPVLVNEQLYRDEDGWLWQPSPPADLDGKPEFKAVNSVRHRTCMDELLCQVCGESAVVDGSSSWLIPAEDLPRDPSREVMAKQPPVCLDCIAVSRENCPHLRKTTWEPVLARETRRWGVLGDLYDVSGDIIFHGRVNAQTHPREAAMTLARQRILTLHDWRLA